MTDEAVQESLATQLAAALPAPIEVLELTRISAGASARLSAALVRDGAGTEHEVVLRTGGIVGGLAIGTAAEARVLQVLEGQSVPVPRVLASFVGDTVLGDGYVMDRLAGETIPRKLLRDPEFESARKALPGDLATALVGIHRAPVAALDGVLEVSDAGTQLALLGDLHRSIGQPSPTFELAFSWLAASLPEPVPPRLVHGDFRNGNLMVGPDGLVAILDWELAHLGDPVEDLGWFCAPAWRFGGPGSAGGFGSRDELVAAYEAASGTHVSEPHLLWWEVLATVKWGVICQVQASRHLDGPGSMEHAAIGRRVGESELDLLLLLEGR